MTNSSSAPAHRQPAPPDELRDRPVRLAIVGTGGMGSVHARLLTANPDAEVTWLVDLDTDRAEALRGDIGGRVTASMEEAFAAENVDAVLIALPTHLHREATERAASFGKHVFCEKPIARTAEDGRAMIAACERAGVTLMIGHVVRFFSESMRIKEILDAGTLGQIAMVRASRVNPPVQEKLPWFADIEKSGGVVTDLMVHELDTLCWFFGDVERIFAHGLSYDPIHTSRDYTMASVRFRNGVIAHIEASWAHSRHRTAMEIAGEHGILDFASEDSATITLQMTEGIDWETNMPPARAYARPSAQLPHARVTAHFIDSLRTGNPVLTDGEAGVRAITLANAVLDSMRTGQVVRFDEQEARIT